MIRRALGCVALLLAAPLAGAAQCDVQLGLGWPPATESHGAAVERLFAAGDTPALSLVRLPVRGKESGVLLVPPAAGVGDWRLRVARADERVSSWSGSGATVSRTLVVDQEPDIDEVPMPAPLAERLVAGWHAALQAAVADGREAPFPAGDAVLFVVGELRVSGDEPACGPAAMLPAQARILIEAVDTGDKRRPRRWSELEQALDALQQELAQAG